jgi:hypothetical protein
MTIYGVNFIRMPDWADADADSAIVCKQLFFGTELTITGTAVAKAHMAAGGLAWRRLISAHGSRTAAAAAIRLPLLALR